MQRILNPINRLIRYLNAPYSVDLQTNESLTTLARNRDLTIFCLVISGVAGIINLTTQQDYLAKYSKYVAIWTLVLGFLSGTIGKSYPKLFKYFISTIIWANVIFEHQFATNRQTLSLLIGSVYGPVFILFACGDNFFTIIHVVLRAGLIYMNKQKFIDYSKEKSYEEIMEAVINQILMATVIVSLLMIRINCQRQDSLKRTYVSEARQKQAEQYKVLLLSFSHEFRNLVNSLIGNIQLCALEDITSKAHQLLRNASFFGDLLLYQINNILDSRKIEVNELEINAHSYNFIDFIDKNWKVFSELISSKQIQGSLLIDKNIPFNLEFDQYRLGQILYNLLSNAVKFTPSEGNIVMRVSWIENITEVNDQCFQPLPFDDDNETLFERDLAFAKFSNTINSFTTTYFNIEESKFNDLSMKIIANTTTSYQQSDQNISPQKGVLKISITDNGVGISQNQKQNMFQKFQQQLDLKNYKMLSQGIGLYISKELTTKMKGNLKVFSKDKMGTTACLCIPMTIIKSQNSLLSSNHHKLDSVLDSVALPTQNVLQIQRQLIHKQTTTKPDIEKSPQVSPTQSQNPMAMLFSPKKILTFQQFKLDKKLSIMIVDDDNFILQILEAYFKKLNLQVSYFARDGMDAYEQYVRIYQNNPSELPNLITMDINMPKMNGKQSAVKIREFEKENNLKECNIIFVSGNCSSSELDFCINPNGMVRAKSFLNKPILLTDLENAIKCVEQ